MTTRPAISTSRPAQCGDGGQWASVLPKPSRAGKESSWFRQTNDPRPRLPAPPVACAHVAQRVRGTSVLSFVGQPRPPSTCATLARVDPSQCRTDTSVVSMANCAPPNRGSPQRRSQVCASHSFSAQPSPCRGPSCSSPLLLPLRGRSWRQHSRQRSLSSPTPLPSHTLRGGGHESRVDGHTCKCVWTEARETETAKEQRAGEMGINACDGAHGAREIRCSSPGPP